MGGQDVASSDRAAGATGGSGAGEGTRERGLQGPERTWQEQGPGGALRAAGGRGTPRMPLGVTENILGAGTVEVTGDSHRANVLNTTTSKCLLSCATLGLAGKNKQRHSAFEKSRQPTLGEGRPCTWGGDRAEWGWGRWGGALRRPGPLPSTEPRGQARAAGSDAKQLPAGPGKNNPGI